jgi:hypothetical protein
VWLSRRQRGPAARIMMASWVRVPISTIHDLQMNLLITKASFAFNYFFLGTISSLPNTTDTSKCPDEVDPLCEWRNYNHKTAFSDKPGVSTMNAVML